jgi:hypothetical protein
MNNPWLKLPKMPPFILKIDRPAIGNLNSQFKEKRKEESLIRDTIIPEPFVGNPFTASVVVLNLNPGLEESDEQWHQTPAFRQAALDNLEHRRMDYPFYLLDPRFKASGGAVYWRKRFRTLIEKYGDRAVAQAICVVEWHPYHSVKSRGHPEDKFCDSQDYNFWLVTQAIERGACIVCLRSRSRWEKVLPKGHKLNTVNSSQAAYLTQNNTCLGLWKRINAKICSHGGGM